MASTKDTSEQPVTEQSNPLTFNIDILPTNEMVSALYSCDQEIFNGWEDSQGINNEKVIETMYQVAGVMKEVIQLGSSGAVVMSGCGTSGRLAFLTARTFNAYLTSQQKEACFQYIIAGRDEALITTQELNEDDPELGAEMLRTATTGKSKVLFIGISCGLSAPFVAGQIDFCLSNPEVYTPVLVGFNPPHLARNVPIQNWSKTFLDVVKDLQLAEKSKKGFLLTPIVGPEPIAGSSRMKSGTSTKILLETLCLVALQPKTNIRQVFSVYQDACDALYKDIDHLTTLAQLAGESLSQKGHVYYLGYDSLGIMSMIDASECPPTFGSALDDVRGFVDGGYSNLKNIDGDLSDMGPHYRISLDDFQNDEEPILQSNDLVILFGEEMLDIVDLGPLVSANSKLACVYFQTDPLADMIGDLVSFSAVLPVRLEPLASSKDLLTSDIDLLTLLSHLRQEAVVKWTVNCVSTLAHVLRGKVYHNYMIDLRVSNKKLFFRGLALVEQFTGRSTSECKECLLRAIYQENTLPEGLMDAPVEDHILALGMRSKVIPTAILLATQKFTIDTALEAIQAQPIIRLLVSAHEAKVAKKN